VVLIKFNEIHRPTEPLTPTSPTFTDVAFSLRPSIPLKPFSNP
jgi:hypothetical protein